MLTQKTDPTKSEVAEFEPLRFPIVGIGASAGGFAALATLLHNLPDKPGLALVVVIHLPADQRSMADRILQSSTNLPVVQVNHTQPILPDHVYVIPPDRTLKMEGGRLALDELRRMPGDPDTIDIFFRTLSLAHGVNAIGVVLSGMGSDGTAGLGSIKKQSGVTIAQLPADAEQGSMPRSAIDSGMVDFVLPAAQIPAKLCELRDTTQRIRIHAERSAEEADVSHDAVSVDLGPNPESALKDVLSILLDRTGHDFREYKPPLLVRRIERRLHVRGLADLPSYCRLLRTDDAEPLGLLKDLLIGVTQFFRDRAAFEALERTVVPALFRNRNPDDEVRVWVTACSTGEEAYSIAMLLADQNAATRHATTFQVFASDIDAHAIGTARAGLYPASIARDVPPERLQRYFTMEDGQYKIRKSLRDRVLFAEHNLLQQAAFSRVDLVTCRNFLIYLNREMQSLVLRKFHFALNTNGYLMLGNAESIDGSTDLFEPVDAKQCIHQARPSVHRLRPTADRLRHHERTVVPGVQDDARPSLPRSRLFSFGEIHLQKTAQMSLPSILINARGEIVHVLEQASGYLRHVGGEPTRDLVALVAPALRLDLRTAIFQAQESEQQTRTGRLHLSGTDSARCLDITVTPFRDPHAEGLLMLVTFQESEDVSDAPVDDQSRNRPLLNRLDDELQITRRKLDETIDEAERSGAQLRTTVEELQTTVEELRARQMELEARNAELQSINEEFKTVVQQLQLNLEDSAKTNDDLNNLVVSSDAATLFLDAEMRILRYTPKIAEIFNIIPADIGRPLMHLTNRLDHQTLTDETAHVLETLQPIEREVKHNDGRTYIVRAHPYRTTDNRIEGAVLTFFDITRRKMAEATVQESEARFRLFVTASSDTLYKMNADWSEMRSLQGMDFLADTDHPSNSWLEKYIPEDDRDSVVSSIQDAIRSKSSFKMEHRVMRADGSVGWTFSHAIPLLDESGAIVEWFGAASDITERKQAQATVRDTEDELATLRKQSRGK